MNKCREFSEPKFFGQYEQDKWVYERFFQDKKNGCFLEIGADDGIDKSNTLFFERYLNWTGICIEPSPRRFSLLKKNRQCRCENVAISDQSGTAQFLDISGWGKGLSGLLNAYPEEHVQRIKREMEHPDNTGSQTYEVETARLEDVLLRSKIKHVDFCSIDTEGSELQILQSINFRKVSFNIVMVENNYKTKDVEEFMVKRGFRLIERLKIDDVYQHQNFVG